VLFVSLSCYAGSRRERVRTRARTRDRDSKCARSHTARQFPQPAVACLEEAALPSPVAPLAHTAGASLVGGAMRESACLLCHHPTHDLPPPLMARILLAFLHTLGGASIAKMALVVSYSQRSRYRPTSGGDGPLWSVWGRRVHSLPHSPAEKRAIIYLIHPSNRIKMIAAGVCHDSLRTFALSGRRERKSIRHV